MMDEENNLIEVDNNSVISSKLALLANENTLKTYRNGYVIAFIHPITKQPIFLANQANISNICYSTDPILPGTSNIKYAKIYSDLNTAKADVYLLRYHHREFLRIITIAKPVIHFHAELLIDSDLEQFKFYKPVELISDKP